jgi:opacity protein-like surface antigen
MINSRQITVSYLLLISCLLGLTSKTWAADYLRKEDIAENAQEAKRAHPYFGLEFGESQASGTAFPLNAGFVYGATAGVEVLKKIGLGLTYQRSSLTYSDSGVNTSVHQILFEVNAFSLLILNGGFHVGDVIKFDNGVRTADVGFGFHAGFDAGLTEHLTVGVVGYVTFVTEREDHHSLINLLVPVKYWF